MAGATVVTLLEASHHTFTANKKMRFDTTTICRLGILTYSEHSHIAQKDLQTFHHLQ